jgi:transposase-like protein
MGMTFEEANELAKKWEDKGNPPCDHPQITKEYMNGTHSDYVCTTCGERRFSREAFRE